MAATRTVVVTGVGVVAPGAIGHAEFWSMLVDGRSAITPLAGLDVAGLPSRIGGQLADERWTTLVSGRQRRTLPRATQLAVAATELARRDAHLGADDVAPARLTIAVGTALGGWADGEAQFQIIAAQGARKVNPFIATAAAPFSCAAAVATATGAQGPQSTFTTGCAAALQAVAHAARTIAFDDADVAIAGGVECPLSPLVIAGMGRTGELAGDDLPPVRASRPFDRDHGGMVLAEGAALFVLESAAHAAARGATPLAAVVGSSGSCDARGLHRVDESGAAGAHALRGLLDRHEVGRGGLDWVCAHANGAPAFDRKEAAVLRGALAADADAVPVSSIKGGLGHPLGAAGAFQSAAVVGAMRHGLVPHTVNLDDPDPACALRHVRERPLPHRVRTALVTSYGYGGVNGFLLLRAADA